MKRPHKYKLLFNDESRLRTVWQIRVTPLRAVALAVCLFLLSVSIALAIIVWTPFKTLLPGYMKHWQRMEVITNAIKVDSLENNFKRNQAYIDNLVRIFDTERQATDSVSLYVPSVVVTDTLMVAGERECAFVREMEEREKYNISITAPLAAEGMIFTMPAPGAVISADTRQNILAAVIIPRGEGIDAISDGTVVDKHYDMQTHTYTIMLQHNKGFISRYSGLGQPVVERGDQVIAGQEIAMQPATSSSTGKIYVEIWRHGLPLVPSVYMRNYNYSETEDASHADY